jgi:hypothetical protein
MQAKRHWMRKPSWPYGNVHAVVLWQEWGKWRWITASGSNIPSDIQILAFFDYLLFTMSARLAAGKLNGPVVSTVQG